MTPADPHRIRSGPHFRRDAVLWVRIARRFLAVRRGLHRKLRRFWWNQQPGFSVAANTYIADGVKLEAEPCGTADGGTIEIRTGTRLCEGVVLTPYGGSILLHENVFLGPYTIVYGNGGVTIGRNTLIAGHTFIVANAHRFEDAHCLIAGQLPTAEGIEIGDDVWIGAGVRVLDGVCIGRGCVVGAGAVVTRSLPEYAIAVGVPARIIGSRDQPIRDQ